MNHATLLTDDWTEAIASYLAHLRSAGQPPTTIASRRQQLQHMARRVPAGPWALTDEQLVAYVNAREWARETRRSRYACYRGFWKWGKRTGRCRRNIAKVLPSVRVVVSEPNPVPVPVYEAALRRADERTALILRMAKEAGMRRAEIAVAHSSDLMPDLVGWSILVHGKGDKRRMVPLTPRLALELRALGDGYIFPGAIDGHLSPRRVYELAAAVLVEPWSLHKLRARFATDTLKSSGGNTLLVQRLMGHANANTTGRYALVDADDARRAVEAAAHVVRELAS